MWRLWFSAAVLLALPAGAVEFKGKVRATVGPGFDSNPRRDFTSSGIAPVPDGFLAGFLQTQGSLLFERVQLSGAYDAAGRKFLFTAPTEDTLVQSGVLDALWAVHELVDLEGTLKARDRRGAGRDYSDLSADAVVGFLPDPHVEVRARGGGHRFLYWDRFAASYFGPSFGITGRYRFDKRHSLWLSGDFEPRRFNADRVNNPGLDPDPSPIERHDSYFSAAAGYSYRGPFQASLSYAYQDSSSNSFGESYRRHRIAGSAAFLLPLDFTVLLSGALTFASYPDGIYLSSELIVLEDDENANNVSMKLVYPLGEHVELDLRGALYFSRLIRNDLTYLRFTTMLGVSVRF